MLVPWFSDLQYTHPKLSLYSLLTLAKRADVHNRVSASELHTIELWAIHGPHNNPLRYTDGNLEQVIAVHTLRVMGQHTLCSLTSLRLQKAFSFTVKYYSRSRKTEC